MPAPEEPEYSDPMVTARAKRAFLWSFSNTLLARFGTVAIGIALARILGPEEFGIYAVAFVALLAVLSFNELGVTLSIVRWRDDPRAIAPTVNTIAVAMSAVLTLVLVALAGPFAQAMGEPDAAPLVRLLSLCVLVNGIVATPAALLQRYFRQDQRMVIDQVNVWVGALVSIGLALLGAGALSVVVGRLAGAITSGVLFLIYSPLPYRFGFVRERIRPLLLFGLPLAGASIIVFLVSFVDQLIVGSMLGAVALGYYVLAFNLASWPVTIFSQPLRSVAPAYFARLQGERQRMRGAFIQVSRLLAAVALPACFALAASADDVVRFVYGEAWLPAADPLRWLALMAAFRIFFELAYDFIVVLGRSRSILVIQIVWVIALVPAIMLGISAWGVAGAAAAQIAVAAVVVSPAYLYELHRAQVGTGALLRAIALPVAGSLLVGAACWAISMSPGGVLPRLFVSGVVTAAAIGAAVTLLRRDLRQVRSSPTSVELTDQVSANHTAGAS